MSTRTSAAATPRQGAVPERYASSSAAAASSTPRSSSAARSSSARSSGPLPPPPSTSVNTWKVEMNRVAVEMSTLRVQARQTRLRDAREVATSEARRARGGNRGGGRGSSLDEMDEDDDEHGSESDWVPPEELRVRTSQALRPNVAGGSSVGFDLNRLGRALVKQVARPMREMRGLWRQMRDAKAAQQAWVEQARAAGKHELAKAHPVEPMDPHTLLELVSNMLWLTQADPVLPPNAQAVLPPSLRDSIVKATRKARAQGVTGSDLPACAFRDAPNYEPFYAPRTEIHDSMPFLPGVAASLRQEIMEMVPLAIEKLRAINTQLPPQQQPPQQLSSSSAALPQTQGLNGEQRTMTPEEHVDAVIQQAVDASAESVAASTPSDPSASAVAAADSPAADPAAPASDVPLFVHGAMAGTNRALPSAWQPEQFVRIYSSLAHNSMRLAFRLHDAEWAERMLELQRVCTECATAHPSFQRLQDLTSGASASPNSPWATLGRDLRYWLSEGIHSGDFFEDSLSGPQLAAHGPMWKEKCMEFIVRANEMSAIHPAPAAAAAGAGAASGGSGPPTKLFANRAEMESAADSLAYVGLQKQHHVGDLMDYVRLLQLHAVQPLNAHPSTRDSHHSMPERMPTVRTSATPGAPPVWLAYTADSISGIWSECQRLRLPLFAKHYANLAVVFSAVQHELVNDLRAQGQWKGSTGHHVRLPRSFDDQFVEPSPPMVDRSGSFTPYESYQVHALQFFPSALRTEPRQLQRLRDLESQRIVDRCTQTLMEMSEAVRQQLELQQTLQRIEDASRPVTLSAASRALSKEQSRVKARGKYRTNLPFAIIEHHPATHQSLEALRSLPLAALPGSGSASGADSSLAPLSSSASKQVLVSYSAKVNSRVILRFLRPLICACVRSGLPHEALAALHLTLRCSMVPSYKLTSAVLFLLSEESLRLNLGYMARLAGFAHNPHEPVHSALHFQGHYRTRNDAQSDNCYQPTLPEPRMTDSPEWSVLRSTMAWASTIQSSWPLTYDTLALLLRIYSDLCSFCFYALEIQAKRSKSSRVPHTRIPLSISELRSVQSQSLANYMALLKVVHSSSTYFRLRDRRMDHESLRPFEIRMVREEMRRKRELMARELGTDDKVRVPPNQALNPEQFSRHARHIRSQLNQTQHHPFMDRSSVDGSPVPKITPEIVEAASIPLLQSWLSTGRTRRHGASTNAQGFAHNGWKQSLFRLISFSLQAVLRTVSGDAHRSFQLVQQVLAMHLDPPEPSMQHTLHELMRAEEARFNAARMAAEQQARRAAKPNKRGRARSSQRFKKVPASVGPEAKELQQLEQAASAGADDLATVSASLPLNLPAKHASHAAWVLLIMCDLGMDPPLPAVEWVHSVLATSPTLADQFYLHCLRRRMQQMFIVPSRPIWNAWIVAEGTKLAVASALMQRPLATIRPPSAFESQAAEQAEAEEDLEMGEEMPLFDTDAAEGQGWEQRSSADAPSKTAEVADGADPAADEEAPFLPSVGDGHSVPRIRATQGDLDAGHAVDADGFLVIPEEELQALRNWRGGEPEDEDEAELEAAEEEEQAAAADSTLPEAVQDHETQWEWVLRHSGLFPLEASDAPAQLNVPGRVYPESPALQGLTLESAAARGGLFRRWLASTLTLDPEHLLSILDCMRSSGLPPDLACFHRALEVLAQMCALAQQPALEEVISAWSPASASTPSPVRALHYALLLLSDLRALGLQPDATFLNNLLYILICNRRHALVQELLSGSAAASATGAGAQQMGFTMMGGGLRRVVDETAVAAAADSQDSDLPPAPVLRVVDVLSLGEELDALESALDSMATEPPPYELTELGPSGREQERLDEDAASEQSSASSSSSASRAIPFYVRPDSITLSVLLGGQSAMEYPANLVRFMLQLQEREELVAALDAKASEWNHKLAAEHAKQNEGNPFARQFRPRTWRHQREPQPAARLRLVA